MGLFGRKRPPKPGAIVEWLDEQELPHFPASVMASLRLLRSDASSGEEVARSIEADPGASIRILGLANSAGLGLRHPVEDLHQAVQLVGRSSIESILIAATVPRMVPEVGGPALDSHHFWLAAARRAAVAGALAELSQPAARSVCWTASLLQNFAVPFLLRGIGDEYEDLLLESRQEAQDLASLEHDQFGWSHAEVALAICNHWQFPERISSAIEGHHDLSGSTACPEPVRISAFLSEDPEADPTPVVERAAEDLNLDVDRVAEAIGQGLEASSEIAGTLG